jgi:hypothetical protein
MVAEAIVSRVSLMEDGGTSTELEPYPHAQINATNLAHSDETDFYDVCYRAREASARSIVAL